MLQSHHVQALTTYGASVQRRQCMIWQQLPAYFCLRMNTAKVKAKRTSFLEDSQDVELFHAEQQARVALFLYYQPLAG